MAKEETPLEYLANYLPTGCINEVLYFLQLYNVHLTITRKRISILGDYRHKTKTQNHRISVNGNLNPYAFLITLLHELAHLITFERHGNRIAPHGPEWKSAFSSLIQHFIRLHIFPDDILHSLTRSQHNPAASSCADEHLMRVLQKYNPPSAWTTVEQIRINQFFKIKGGRVFLRGEKQRTRYKCKELATGKEYLFNALYEVIALKQ
ncbi:MAG: SprT-like domain-containing protein [Ferruginibacter sp.]|nr:SprT-like domain-containing protein [Ferruginibacter sp.]